MALKNYFCFLLTVFVFVELGACTEDNFYFGKFPNGFKWGVTSSMSSNGRSNRTDKYDIEAMKMLGVTSYSFPVSWAGLLERSVDDRLQPGDVQYYNTLLDELLNNGIEPVVSLNHNELPPVYTQAHQGWGDKTNIQRYCNFAKNVFSHFGQKVKHWTTFTDPAGAVYKEQSQGSSRYCSSPNGYAAAHNMMLAHACAYREYKAGNYSGQVGINLGASWFEAKDPSEERIGDTVRKAFMLDVGWFASPVLTGDYPEEMKHQFEVNVKQFTSDEMNQINGSADFISISFDTSYQVSKDTSNTPDCGMILSQDETWKRSHFPETYVNPVGLRWFLKKFTDMFPKVPIYVSKTSILDETANVRDKLRVEWIREHADETLKAIELDNCSTIKGFNVEGLMDRDNGMQNDGLFIFDPSDVDKMIKRKSSAVLYTQIIKDNGFMRGYNGPGSFPSGPIAHEDGIYYDQFPEDFAWSSATAAYQVEGGWNADGKGKSIWDVMAQNPGSTYNSDNGNIACDSYHKYMDDVRIIKQLGTKYYRFSISWPRVLPTGTIDNINQKGIDYYNNLINALVAEGISPMVTLYHWDLPDSLQQAYGGWLNETIVQHYRDYAKLCFDRFGDRVKLWITFNEPWVVAYLGYGVAAFAPNHYSPGIDIYKVTHNIIKAHASAYHAYNHSLGGKVGITLNVGWSEPLDMFNPEDLEASERALQFDVGWFAHAIYINGDYPTVMKESIARKSKIQNFTTSRLPVFTETEKLYIKGTYDFLGLNFYTSGYVTTDNHTDDWATYDNDKNNRGSGDPDWVGSGSGWLKVTPFGLRKILNWLKKSYNNTPVYVTENGISDVNGSLYDFHRIHYYRTYINEMLKAIKLDGCNVKGYTAWSLMDNFEWARGYYERFGLHYVDFNDPNRTRVPKLSSRWYNQLVTDNGFKPGFPGKGGRGIAPEQDGKFYYDTFPDGFDWGVATSAYQIEGAWNQDGRGVSIWDTFAHNNRLKNGDTGDVACDSYHRYKDDVRILKDLKVTSYRFSISWTRIFPNGSWPVNELGVKYYKDLIEELTKKADIKPVVTLYYWDMPQNLQDKGGWLNDSTVERFKEFADLCFERFGDKVKMWITLNEPFMASNLGYGLGQDAPGVTGPGVKDYQAAHNMLKAHGKVYRLYKSKYSWQAGQIGIALNADWREPADVLSPDDWEASEWGMQWSLGWFANPIFGGGDYPEILRQKVADRSKLQNLVSSRLPMLTDQEQQELNGSADFIGISAFTGYQCTKKQYELTESGTMIDVGISCSQDKTWKSSGSSWLKQVPWALRKSLNWIKNQYGDVPVYVVSNGVSDNTGDVNDGDRVDYIKAYTNEVLKAIKLDGVNVKGYTAWSLMDNLEWTSGYSEKFGLYHVNFDDPMRTRTPKASAVFYRNLITDHGFKDNAFGLTSEIEEDDGLIYGEFPEGFAWSAATASYQIEGGVNEGGRGDSIWDKFSHTYGNVENNDTGDVACDSYHRYKEDVQLLKAMNVSHYRFSIAWPRIFPMGEGTPNQNGIAYYNKLIDELIANGITPVITLYHWDLPQALEDKGGWLNRTTADLFEKYADECFHNFGDRVKFWITLNEPWCSSYLGYGAGAHAPGYTKSGTYPYEAAHTLILAHSKAYRKYESDYKTKQHGQVGITLNIDWWVPKNPLDPADWNAADRAFQFHLGWFANPIFGSGDYPAVMKSQIHRKSDEQGLNKSRLPEFTNDEKKVIKGSFDFFGLNLYTSTRASNHNFSKTEISYQSDQDQFEDKDPNWLGSGSSWLKVTPKALRRVLNWIKAQYGDVPVYVTENGVSDTNGTLHDYHRIHYYRSYINELLKAIKVDGCNVKGYTAWSLMDNFEWALGYSERFGLHYVNFSDPARPRTPKASSKWFKQLVSENKFSHGYTAMGGRGIAPEEEGKFYHGTFPEDFIWSAATSAYQIEGGWDADGKGKSIWDTYMQTPGRNKDGDTGNIACDSYHKYKEDVRLLKELRVSHYRFSVSWPRVIPQGTGQVNNPGLQYYNNLIDELLKNGIQPMITLYHWDLPQALEDRGGWLNEESIGWFKEYADLCFRTYGDRVKYWITFNEPWIVSYLNYGTGQGAPAKHGPGTNSYIVAHNLLRAHGKAARLYKNQYQESQNGQIGITYNTDWNEPNDEFSPSDWAASERSMQFALGWFAEPIFGSGDYPQVMKDMIGNKSLAQGLSKSRLPVFTEEEKAELRGSGDFIGINHYTSSLCNEKQYDPSQISWDKDYDVECKKDPTWKGSASSWLKVVPWGLRKLVNWIKVHYGDKPIFITENGISDSTGELNDTDRVEYYRAYTNELLKAIRLDGVNVKGYTAWALLDNLEWDAGYSVHFGIHAVNFSDPERTRTPKASAAFYRNLIFDNGYPEGGLTTELPLPNGLLYEEYPEDFVWSAATASYQVEGGYKDGGRGLSIWDKYSHTDGKVDNGDTGDIACDSYHKYKEDVQIIKNMKLKHYRFSIAWPRIFPNGFGSTPNQPGIDYYNNLINELIANDIVPMVTLYHWDLPQALEDLGGWPNRTTADHFEAYADVCFREFGDRVKFWITLNEPWVSSVLGYGTGGNAPGLTESGTLSYQSAHTLLLAHGKAYRLYNRKYKPWQKGRVGITLNCDWWTPRDMNSPADINAAERGLEFHLGWFAEPVYGSGDYPQVMKDLIKQKSESQGVNNRLPEFSWEDKDLLKGSSDFFGLNQYTTVRAESHIGTDKQGSYFNDMDLTESADPEWLESGSSWLKVTPKAIRRVINWIRLKYGGDWPIYVTENGVSDRNGTLKDYHRIHFFRSYTNELLKAIKLDGCNVKGYTAWSLLDNFEWARGYTERFGMNYVDFNDPNRPRTPKGSSRWYSELVTENKFRHGYTAVGGRGIAPEEEGKFYYGTFPEDFVWSAATSAYQIEGGWDADGKGKSIWDTYMQAADRNKDGDTGNIACDSYHKYKEDVRLLKELKVSHYRFSVSWPRVIPQGTGKVNNPGLQYYDNLIDELLKNGIQPMITLYHWDLPQALEDRGGWLNESSVGWFKEYADLCFKTYGDRIKYWITFNEPWIVSYLNYGTGQGAPAKHGPGTNSYIVAHNLLRAHGKAARLYKNKYQESQNGQIGITYNTDWNEPNDEFSPSDWAASERSMQFALGWFAEPIFGSGDYPQVMKDMIGNKSLAQGLNKSRLPVFTEEEKAELRGSGDFIGINHYTSSLCNEKQYDPSQISWDKDYDVECRKDPTWKGSGSSWLKVVPWGLRKLVNWIKVHYGDKPIFITENGISDSTGELNDTDRVEYYRAYTNELLKAIKLDGVNVKGYTAWALLDNLEWDAGYSVHFGIHAVNFSDPERSRTPKASAAFYRNLIMDNGFRKGGLLEEIPYENEKLYGQFPEGFMWGAATSAYQIEGGVNKGGRGKANWDTFSHTPGKVMNNANGDVACDSYNKFAEDINILRSIKVNHYRFSIAWSRIFPSGFGSTPNQNGINYYNSVINMLLEANIVPMVTLFHWDLPQALEDRGGWTNENTADMFAQYADVCFREFGDRVKLWITLNEPWVVSVLGYGTGEYAPGYTNSGTDSYKAGKTLILAHAKAYRLYERKYKAQQKGQVGITLNTEWFAPKNPQSPADWNAADRSLQFHLGWFAHPVFVNGDYPEVMKEYVNRDGRGRLPLFTLEEKKMINGSADFFGLNEYTSNLTSSHVFGPQSVPTYFTDMDLVTSQDLSWPSTGSDWFRVYPLGMRRLLNWIKKSYNNIPVYITENGLSDRNATIEDHHRVKYYQDYINEVMKAVNLDGVNVKGYTAWSLMDNFEWSHGYVERFGMHYVNFSDPARPRIPKLSASAYREIVMENGFPKEPVSPVTLGYEDKFFNGRFPKDFAWSVATAAYQVEGGWNEDGKGESIWDRFSHTNKIDNQDTGDVACDTYHKYLDDIQLLKKLKVTHYRFSISWPRILPDGTTKYINPAGVAYYNELINALLDAEIVPMVTMYHWDIPQVLQDQGGWANDSVVDLFVNYANVLFENFGDRIQFWITHNEPGVVATHGYEMGTHAPGVLNQGYRAAHNLIRSHGKVYQLYQSNYKLAQKGSIGITLSHTARVPYNKQSVADVEAAERANLFDLGWYAQPIFGNGDYPDVMKWQIGNKSLESGLKQSRLPEFTAAEKIMLKDSADFFGYNMYTSRYIRAFMQPLSPANWETDRDVEEIVDPDWPKSGSDWLRVTPFGIRDGLNWIREHYNNVPVYVTENGVSDRTEAIDDQFRVQFYKAYLNEVLKAIRLDGCHVRGYTAWSFMDNFEWMRGYSERFGLHYVNFSHPERPRTPKASAKYFTSIIEKNGFLKAGEALPTQVNPMYTAQPGQGMSMEPIVVKFNNMDESTSGVIASLTANSIVFCCVILISVFFNVNRWLDS